MKLWPGSEKVHTCGLCGHYTYVKASDDILGWICDDCRFAVNLADAILQRPMNHMRPPEKGDWMPETELL